MLDYNTAANLYHTISARAVEHTEPVFREFYAKFLRSAADYAATRADWRFLDNVQRIDCDKARSTEHDTFMARLSAICRNLDITDVDTLLLDRKAKGDFACYVALFLALEQR